MGIIHTTCCSTHEVVIPEEHDINKPIMYTYPDEYLNDIDVHRSASELTRIPIEDINPN